MIIIKNSKENEGKSNNNKKLKIQFNPGVLSE